MFKSIFIIFLVFLIITSAKSNDIKQVEKSKYSLGFNFGFSRLYPGIGKNSFAELTDKGTVDGFVGGFFFEYKFPETDASIVILSEALYPDFENNTKYESLINFNSIGVKAKVLNFINITPAIGIISGEKVQFVRSISLGYDIWSDKHSVYAVDFSYSDTDFNDKFISLKFLYSFKL